MRAGLKPCATVLENALIVLRASVDNLRVWTESGRWWALQDSNLRPRPCEGRALPTELSAPARG
jgi:hypothetical protein